MCRLIVISVIIFVCSGCGGGSAVNGDNGMIQKKVSLGSQGGAATINGIDMTISLPPGVRVSVNSSNELTSQILSLSDNTLGSSLVSRYVPASSTSNALIYISVTNANGFSVGPLAALMLSAPTGSTLSAENLLQYVTEFQAYDGSGFVLSSVSPVISVN